MIDGKTLIQWGFKPGRWFSNALKTGNELLAQGHPLAWVEEELRKMQPVQRELRADAIPYSIFLEPESEDEQNDLDAVVRDMDQLMRVPTIKAGAIMPDACPAGVIPVGAIVAAENAIHPGFHSADICCSMAMTVFQFDASPRAILDIAQDITHFGRGRREGAIATLPRSLVERMERNPFLSDLVGVAYGALSSQGDGNHFLYLGRRRSDGRLTLVTHHGSRNLGAILYKKGMAAAKKHTATLAPGVPAKSAWLDADSEIGRDYWEALQIVRDWTKLNHFSIHDAITTVAGNRIYDRDWNEHNFVFQRSDGLFYHGKGATPSFGGFAPDNGGRTLIPLNMAEPILVTEHTNRADALGFAPHGAGRNMSRTRYLREVVGDRPIEELMPADLDVRFFVGVPDLSELPGAYKNAEQVRSSIQKHNLASVVDVIDPYGSIMAGDEPKPWLNKDKKA